MSCYLKISTFLKTYSDNSLKFLLIYDLGELFQFIYDNLKFIDILYPLTSQFFFHLIINK